MPIPELPSEMVMQVSQSASAVAMATLLVVNCLTVIDCS